MNPSLSIAIALFLSFFIIPLHATEKPKKTIIAVQPYKGFSKELTKLVAKGLEADYEMTVVILPVTALPKEAYYKPRSRYRADILLDYLGADVNVPFTKIIGLTHKDISTTNGEHYDWGIFGLGSMGGKPCVVSTFRLRARGANDKLFRQRLARVATHEIGHTLGLPHCPNKNCNMVDAEGSILSVDKGTGKLCAPCKKRINGSPEIQYTSP